MKQRSTCTRSALPALLLLVSTMALAQPGITPEPAGIDTSPVVVRQKKSSIFSGRPGTSMLMSLAVPGAGQLYNKSYLRVPFVYAAIGTAGYFLVDNTRKYRLIKEAYMARVDDMPWTPPSNLPKGFEGLGQITSLSQLRELRDKYNGYRQQSIIIFSLVWLANGIDAFVDAHLKDFDINENLSIAIDPTPGGIGLIVFF